MKSDVVVISSADDGTGHSCGFEFVPNRKKPKAIYVVFDGRRIAYRADPIGPHARTWVPMESGISVIDEAPDTLAVFIDGVRLH